LRPAELVCLLCAVPIALLPPPPILRGSRLTFFVSRQWQQDALRHHGCQVMNQAVFAGYRFVGGLKPLLLSF
jgi:hypothetical protein